MRCPKCGQEVARGQAVCPSCGSPVKKRGRRSLGGAIFVIFFVLIVSAVLIFLNLRSRGDLPELSFSNIRSLFVQDKAEPAEPAAEPEPEPADEPTEEPEPADEPEPVEEPAPADEPEPAEEPEPADEPVGAAAAEPAEATALEPLEAWRAAEQAHFDSLCKAWDACREADAEAPGQLLRGDARLLLRLGLSALLDSDAAAQLALQSEGEPESWDLFAAKTGDANAAFLPLLASENFTSLLGEYRDIILNGVEAVSVGDELLEAEGILERCPGSFRVDLDAADVRRIASSLIGALRWDERISRILDNADDYAAFRARLDELDYALDTGAVPDGVLHMVLYVDESGQYRGRSLSFEGAERSGRILLALPQEEETFGLELSVRDSEGLRSLSGRGVAAGDAFRGSFRLLRDGKAAAEITAGLAG